MEKILETFKCGSPKFPKANYFVFFLNRVWKQYVKKKKQKKKPKTNKQKNLHSTYKEHLSRACSPRVMSI